MLWVMTEVRDSVLQKRNHELLLRDGKKQPLVVTLYEDEYPKSEPSPGSPKSPAESPVRRRDSDSPPPPDPSHVTLDTPPPLVLIENVQDSYTQEMLNILVENVSNKGAGSDFYVELIPEIKSAVLSFTSSIDILSFIGAFSQSPRVHKLKLTAKPLDETKSVRAENLPQKMSEDHLVVYFESPKYGGGPVMGVNVMPEEKAAIITFCDKAVVQTVLAKQHVFGEKPISVYPHYVSLGITLYGKNGPSVTLPQPLEFPISPYILEFILRDTQIKLNIDKKMSDLYCDITWPDPNCSSPTIQLSITSSVTSHLRTMAKVVPTWTDRVSNEFSLTISKFKAAEFNVSTSVWEAIKGEASSSTYEGILVTPNLAKQKVFLAGLSKDIIKIEKTFRDLVEKKVIQIDRDSRSLEMSEPLVPALYEMMRKAGHMTKIQSQVPEIRIEYDKSTRNIKLVGVKEEVLVAKCEILKITQQLKSKSIPRDPHIINFLNAADNDELSCFLFTRHNINAMFQVEGSTVTLKGWSIKDLTEAEGQMSREVLFKEVHVGDQKILQIPEWESLKKNLNGKFNAEKCTIILEENLKESNTQVVVTGLAVNVENAFQQVHDFVERNTPMQKEIIVRSMAVMRLFVEKKEEIVKDIKPNRVNVLTERNKINLSGTRLYVQEAANLIDKFLSFLHCDVLHINKPGAKKFYIEKEEMYADMAKTKFHCVIHLQKDGEERFIAREPNRNKPECQIMLPNGIAVAVYKDDLTRHRVDVVVNASNEDLQHIGGLAQALLNVAGPKLQTDCDQIIKREGKLSVGDAVITDGGNLVCKQVIHTVGPRWKQSSATDCERLLRKAISRCLDLAAEKGHTSIGIPAVSSGIFGFPVESCVENIVESIHRFVDNQAGKSPIKRIHLVDTGDRIISAFSKAIKMEFRDQNVQLSPKRNTKGEEKRRPNRVTESGDQKLIKNGVTINLIHGNIQDATTDVIVNSIGRDLDMDAGGASRALLHKAGKKIQQLLLNESGGKKAEAGSVYPTEGCSLSCKMVLHGIAPHWNNGKDCAEKILRQIIQTCLSKTEQKKLNSISFPAVGTGALSFPRNMVADWMFEEVLQFISKNNPQHLNQVNFVLHPSDTETAKAFSVELTKRTDLNKPEFSSLPTAGSVKGSAFIGAVTTPTLGVHEMRIGSVTYQVKTGDITKEDVDIIVNSSNGTFTLKAGVSKAILEAAGPSVEAECTRLGSIPHDGHILTDSGNLLCKKILHICGRNSPSQIKTCVLEALQECEKFKAASVAFPAIGTGGGSVQSEAVAGAMQDAVVDFISSKAPQSLQMVKIIIFQNQMLNDFYTCMKKKEGADLPKQTSFINKIASLFSFMSPKSEESAEQFVELKENIEPAIFYLCGEKKEQVKEASSWLKTLILNEQDKTVISDEWIRDFDHQEQKTLSELQKRFQVEISIDSTGPSITVSGLTRDVYKITKDIEMMIKKIRDKKMREREADLCSNVVDWRYQDGAKFVSFDKMSNMELEKAKTEGRLVFTIDVSGVKYNVDLEQKVACDSKGKTLKIERVPKGESLDLPPHWDTMNNDLVKVVMLSPTSSEYKDVQGLFAISCHMKIIKIERVQNKHMWLNYQIKKQSLDAKNRSTNNEKQLFHGTDANTIKTVNHNNFNRSYAGRNAAAYGNGTYFAVHASYSAHDTYSRPDAAGQKLMYLARVLTGVYCRGSQGIVAPPAKSAADPTDLYDSVTDNPANPQMFIIFNDVQAYPEYLITFSR
ncbi:hypothetical protein GDO86_016710 [Hymenochirus boettgeri]|uniref:Poly [ADP-ribose] polymerase n=1 Tax=Hymenochirus boettgeri TaxID=247094 RepID=A0A8T2INR2_9PIPI|nr:hypothetical protein GDO86_016710 [Hymenochirus boettgeri]